MPNPQDVAVPSPPEREIVLPCRPASAFFHRFKDGKCAALERLQQAQERREDGWQGHWRPVYVGDALDAYARAAVIADRAAGRASAEPEGFWLAPLVPDEHMVISAGGFPYDCSHNDMLLLHYRNMRDSWRSRSPAAPTPTASIAPKAEAPWEHLKQYGYAPGGYLSKCHACEKVVEFVDKRAITCRPCAEAMHAAPKAEGVHDFAAQPSAEDSLNAMVEHQLAERASRPFESEGNRRVAPKAEGEADENFVSRWTRVIRDMPSTYEHPAAPAAQAAAGASDDVLAKLRWVDHVLGEVRQQVAAIESLSYGRARDKLKEVIAALSPRPEADADRASGGGVDTERLNWLLANPNTVLEDAGNEWFILDADSEPTYFKSGREAIDAARATLTTKD